MIRPLVAALALVSLAAPAMAQQHLTLERIFGNPPLAGPTPRLLKLSPDGRWLTSLRNRADEKERFDLWALDTKTGAERMLVDSKAFGTGATLSEAERMQRERARIADQKGIVAYDWSADSQTLLVPLDGDLFLASLDGKVRRLTDTKTSELDGTVSPKGHLVSFVRDQNLMILDLATGKERQLTKGGGGTVSWGTAEFVAQEEMHRNRGHWWSPDDRLIAVERSDEAPVAIVTRAAIGAEGTRVYQQRYPKAGTDNAVVELHVFDVATGKSVKVDLGTDPDIYLARVDWTKDGKTLLVQRESRDQKKLDMLRVDPATGKSSVLFTETAKTWINLHDNLKPLSDGSLLWASERDGFSHLYRWKDGAWMQLTSGPWEVRSVEGVDEAKGLAYIVANRETPIEWQLYAVPIKAPGTPKQLTDSGFSNAVEMDKSGTHAIVTRSSTGQPPQTYLAEADGQGRRWVEQNRLAGDHPYAPFLASHVAPKFGTIKAADGVTDLYYKVYVPTGFTGPRPVLLWVYGGPGTGGQARNEWMRDLPVQQYLVSKGWVIFSVDNRGTADRGKAFEDPIYHAMGTVEVADQLKAVDWLKTQLFVDPKRIAVFGWSYGGYMTLKLLEAAPGTFVAGVAGAPVTRWELYDTHYTERYLGDPRKVPEVYEKSDALPDATTIKDPLLLIHGMSDDNVVFDNSTALMAKLQAAAIPFETMVYPGFGHRVAGPDVSVHLWRTIENYLDRHVGEGR
ncbi:alpha/beta fold hydrolase [Sphingomonas sp. MAH-20]|uniref:Alpha/beta fold hydrolase n=1 Tax=Sphingomonas horti TaxID=2682842 RepID=A0A6I4IYP5_9SPHN|nr:MULTISPECIES: S9 family peptidase [Sphingomonas]MBA2918403.1 S9 family peptidase [Sphingomonas sp. CGMCC 1.13658]MVO77370.1 alpha/beta fold hydrolase [Sphingomonas horti]